MGCAPALAEPYLTVGSSYREIIRFSNLFSFWQPWGMLDAVLLAHVLDFLCVLRKSVPRHCSIHLPHARSYPCLIFEVLPD